VLSILVALAALLFTGIGVRLQADATTDQIKANRSSQQATDHRYAARLSLIVESSVSRPTQRYSVNNRTPSPVDVLLVYKAESIYLGVDENAGPKKDDAVQPMGTYRDSFGVTYGLYAQRGGFLVYSVALSPCSALKFSSNHDLVARPRPGMERISSPPSAAIFGDPLGKQWIAFPSAPPREFKSRILGPVVGLQFGTKIGFSDPSDPNGTRHGGEFMELSDCGTG
jgi:hypothetical protein